MKHTYPRAIALVTSGAVDLRPLLSHHFSLTETARAFQIADTYADGALKVTIHVGG
jgi:threonine dehydrogenase-like Zn-dependent dehydrogenase